MRLDELIALNDELIALSRAGLPIGAGLLGARRGLRRRIRGLTERVATRLEAGMSLEEALRSDSQAVPPGYLAMIRAALAANDLTGPLETLATVWQRARNLRNTLLVAGIYPIIVCVLASLAFLFVMPDVYASLRTALRIDPQVFHGGLDRALAGMTRISPWLGGVIGCVPLLAVLWPARSLGRAKSPLLAGPSPGPLTWLPGVTPIIRLQRCSAFLRVLGTMLRRKVPLGQGILLAAEVTGSPEWIDEARRLADVIEQGGAVDAGRPTTSRGSMNSLPPLVGALLRNPADRARLPEILTSLADHYDQRTDYAVLLAQWKIPVVMTLLFAGLALLLVASSFLGPWYWILGRLSHSV